MNAFEQHAQAPRTWQEHVQRDEDIARSEERRRLEIELAFEYRYDIEYEDPEPGYPDELREFTGKRVPITAETGCTPAEVAAFPRKRAARMQGELFEEVA